MNFFECAIYATLPGFLLIPDRKPLPLLLRRSLSNEIHVPLYTEELTTPRLSLILINSLLIVRASKISPNVFLALILTLSLKIVKYSVSSSADVKLTVLV